MFNYYNPCSMCIPPMVPMGYGYDHISETKENDDDLNCLYPKIYFKVYPLVKRHCDMMEREKGKDYCPCEKEVDGACKEIYKRIKPELDEDEDDYSRQRRYRRRHAVNDLIRIILINELFDRRRRRRRRPYSYNPNYDYNYSYDNYDNYDNYDDYYDFDDDDD